MAKLLVLVLVSIIFGIGHGQSTSCPPLQPPDGIVISCMIMDNGSNSTVIDCLSANATLLKGTIAKYKCKSSGEDGWTNSTLKCICRGKWKGLMQFNSFAVEKCASKPMNISGAQGDKDDSTESSSSPVVVASSNGTLNDLPLNGNETTGRMNDTDSSSPSSISGDAMTMPSINGNNVTNLNSTSTSVETNGTNNVVPDGNAKAANGSPPESLEMSSNVTSADQPQISNGTSSDSMGADRDGKSFSFSINALMTNTTSDGSNSTSPTDASNSNMASSSNTTTVSPSDTTTLSSTSGVSNSSVSGIPLSLNTLDSTTTEASSGGQNSTTSDFGSTTSPSTNSSDASGTSSSGSNSTISNPSVDNATTSASNDTSTTSADNVSSTTSSTLGNASVASRDSTTMASSNSSDVSSSDGSSSTTPSSNTLSNLTISSISANDTNSVNSDSSGTSTTTPSSGVFDPNVSSSANDASSSTTSASVSPDTNSTTQGSDSMSSPISSTNGTSSFNSTSTPSSVDNSTFVTTTSPGDMSGSLSSSGDRESKDLKGFATQNPMINDASSSNPASSGASDSTTHTSSGILNATSPSSSDSASTTPSSSSSDSSSMSPTSGSSLAVMNSSMAANMAGENGTTTISPLTSVGSESHNTSSAPSELSSLENISNTTPSQSMESSSVTPLTMSQDSINATNTTQEGANPGSNTNFTDFQLNGLELHNKLRKNHKSQPIELNQTLNDFAQKYADSIVNQSKLQASPGKRPYAQNLYKISGDPNINPIEAVEGAIKAWYASSSGYNFTSPKATGFSQIVWNATNQIGIGFAKDKGTSVVVATYSPRGNVIAVGKNGTLTDKFFYFKKNVFPMIDNPEDVFDSNSTKSTNSTN